MRSGKTAFIGNATTLLAVILLSSCAGLAPEDAKLELKPAAFSSLPGWNDDDLEGIRDAFEKSCARILKQTPENKFGPDGTGGAFADWKQACEALPAASGNLHAFFEHWFTPWQATGAGSDRGLFTGYYEASLRGSRTRGGGYQTPLYKRPADLVMVDLGEFRDELKGQRIAGRVIDARLKPYEDRAKIASGEWPHNDEALVWVDSPVDAFFLQVQGSGRILLDDGSQMRVGFDGQNGHPYYAIGRELVRRNIMDKDSVSMQSIRLWLAAHPDEAAALMNLNKSYVFFKELDGDGPLGGEGVALTPMRSLAIDRARLPYGMPVWVDIPEPLPGTDTQTPPLRRLMIAQDTGGAIRGPVRGDFFWGFGPQAEEMAGKMKGIGRYWLLLPKK